VEGVLVWQLRGKRDSIIQLSELFPVDRGGVRDEILAGVVVAATANCEDGQGLVCRRCFEGVWA
jgi:hypothetical protein